jgi:hypothetical protein
VVGERAGDGDRGRDGRRGHGARTRQFADRDVGAVSGNARVGNRGGLLGKWPHIEYVIGFNLDRRMYDVLECMPTVPGAIGAFRLSACARSAACPPTPSLRTPT